MRRAGIIPAVLLLTALSASADTIVLKNGRRIAASNVSEDGDHVSYETYAGRLSIPKSIVLRIDHDGTTPASDPVSSPPVSPPQVNLSEGYGDVAHAAVHDGSIDFAYIERVEIDARGGSAFAVAKVAAAHHVAAQFLLRQGDLGGAIDHYRRALSFAPQHLGLLLNLAVLQLRRSEYTAALDTLEHARRVAPDSADVAKLMGWGYSGANKLDQAVEEWKRAESLRRDPDVERALAKAERDRAEESDYREGETAHFALKYYGGAAPALARGILRTLEDHFGELESELDYTPPEQIGVILYTGQAFADITRAPGWAGAVNDGRIRVPVQGLVSVTPDLSRVLKHELTHSFVQQKTRGRCPVWLQEGVAQWMEGRRSSGAAAALVALYDRKQLPQLGTLEGSWMSLSGGAAGFAYAWALATVEMIIETQGISDLERLLDQVAVMPSTEAALKESLRSDYADLEQQTAAYLRRTYMH